MIIYLVNLFRNRRAVRFATAIRDGERWQRVRVLSGSQQQQPKRQQYETSY